MWLVPYAETLTELDLSSNDIQRLPDVVPWQLESLKKLDVSSNQLHAFMDGGTVGKILCIRFVALSFCFEVSFSGTKHEHSQYR